MSILTPEYLNLGLNLSMFYPNLLKSEVDRTIGTLSFLPWNHYSDCVDRITDCVDWKYSTLFSESHPSVLALISLSLLESAFLKASFYHHIFNHPLPGYQKGQDKSFYLLLLEWSWTVNQKDLNRKS